MLQQLIALIIVLAILARLGYQFYKDQLPKNQFVLWLIFWFVAGLSIIFIKSLDHLADYLGFSSSGIQILLYVAVVVIFYFIFRFRLKIALLEKNLTKLTRYLALEDKDKPTNK